MHDDETEVSPSMSASKGYNKSKKKIDQVIQYEITHYTIYGTPAYLIV